MIHQHSKTYYIYILASGPGGAFYIGVTNDVIFRTSKHKDGTGSKFTRKYGVNRLVYYETAMDIESAIRREKQLKKWNREWKINLILRMNPQWKDLYEELLAA